MTMQTLTLGKYARGIAGLKPHLYAVRGSRYWYCVGRGISVLGSSVGNAYAAWRCAWRYHCQVTGKPDDTLL